MVTRVKIKNFRGIDDLDLELGPLNIVIGANGSGKSNFIEAFRFLQGCATQPIRSAINEFGGGKYLVNRQCPDKPIEFGWSIEGTHNTNNICIAMDLSIKPEGVDDPVVIHESYSFSRDNIKTSHFALIDTPNSIFHYKDENVDTKFKLNFSGGRVLAPQGVFPAPPTPVFFALAPPEAAERIYVDYRSMLYHLSEILYISPYSLYTDHRRRRELNRQDDEWTNPWKHLKSDDLPSYLSFIKNNRQEAFDELQAWLRVMLLNFSSMDIRRDLQDRIDVMLVWKDRAESIPLEYASDGTLSMILLGCYISSVKARPSLYEHTHLILDEPDASLHPVAQRLLAEALLSASEDGLQVTITTHNRSFLDDFFAAGGASWDNVIAFDEPSVGRTGPLRFRNLGKDEFAKNWIEKFSLRPSEAWDSGVLGARQ